MGYRDNFYAMTKQDQNTYRQILQIITTKGKNIGTERGFISVYDDALSYETDMCTYTTIKPIREQHFNEPEIVLVHKENSEIIEIGHPMFQILMYKDKQLQETIQDQIDFYPAFEAAWSRKRMHLHYLDFGKHPNQDTIKNYLGAFSNPTDPHKARKSIEEDLIEAAHINQDELMSPGLAKVLSHFIKDEYVNPVALATVLYRNNPEDLRRLVEEVNFARREVQAVMGQSQQQNVVENEDVEKGMFADTTFDLVNFPNPPHMEKKDYSIIPAGTIKIVMASRLGDVGITNDLDAENGYIARVSPDMLMNIRREKTREKVSGR